MVLRAALIFTLFLAVALPAGAQSAAARNEAHELAREGEALLDSARYKEAIQKISRAAKLDPKNKQFTTLLARAHFYDGNHATCMELTRPLMEGRHAMFEAFQLYGNCLNETGKDYEALETYRKGLARFPNSGVLYMEMGIVEYTRGRDTSALHYWEQGIRVQPTFPPNYYLAAKAQFTRRDYAWAAIYAETFINLERMGERVREMSKLLFAAYAQARTYDYQGIFHWRFYQVYSAAPAEVVHGSTPQPLDARLLLHATLDEAFLSELPDTAWTPDIASLGDTRRFAAYYVQTRLPDNPAKELFKWQQAIAAQGHFEAYNYWLLYDARPDEFFAWYETHKDAYEQFEAWFLRTPLQKYLGNPVVREAPVTLKH